MLICLTINENWCSVNKWSLIIHNDNSILQHNTIQLSIKKYKICTKKYKIYFGKKNPFSVNDSIVNKSINSKLSQQKKLIAYWTDIIFAVFVTIFILIIEPTHDRLTTCPQYQGSLSHYHPHSGISHSVPWFQIASCH